MLAALVLIASAAQSSFEALRPQFYGAIWYDLSVNATIGNGNWPASLWYRAAPETKDGAPNLHILNLTCTPRGRDYRCTFILFRDGGVARVHGEDAPDRLTCSAALRRDVKDGEESWAVRHTPPPKGRGHTQTTMRCAAGPGG